ncbi:hypothetical protein IWQ60_003742 [Tieghemiomyces parasiticus]|uniref:Uncharacterized protein n=1 Tax=Tieghemiomyces parasiticus TaxID=78921 RepID=A0A9W8AHC8_9FUNG|nr:hypothetical protein IWQ60_003742 [Tieghemiomyces parasiticus]
MSAIEAFTEPLGVADLDKYRTQCAGWSNPTATANAEKATLVAAWAPSFLDRYYKRHVYVPGATAWRKPPTGEPASALDTQAPLYTSETSAAAEPEPAVSQPAPEFDRAQLVWQAPNKLCLVGLAPEHKLVGQYEAFRRAHPPTNPFITQIVFHTGEEEAAGPGVDGPNRKRGRDRKHGRGKSGGKPPKYALTPLLYPETPLCTLTLHDGQTHDLEAGVFQAHVYEFNDKLKAQPDLLFTTPDHGGFVAIMNPVKENDRVTLKRCLSPTEYQIALTTAATAEQSGTPAS